jgi:hypothetical protein
VSVLKGCLGNDGPNSWIPLRLHFDELDLPYVLPETGSIVDVTFNEDESVRFDSRRIDSILLYVISPTEQRISAVPRILNPLRVPKMKVRVYQSE